MCLLTFLQLLVVAFVSAQIVISGNVYDSSKLFALPDVTVQSTSGGISLTDSLGRYEISVQPADSISFVYNGKSTLKFPVKTIADYNSFDISLRVQLKNKDRYKMLKPVTVLMSSYQQDSLENRQEYANIFQGSRHGITSTYDPGGAAGLDLDALIGAFQFRKNKQRLAFQNRLLQEEQDRYVDYRFSPKVISRITGLTGDTLEMYRKLYRPDYYFVVNSTLAEFYEYILNTSYAFKKREGIK